MVIRTNEKNVTMAWVREETALMALDDHPDDETLTVTDLSKRTLFVCTFRALKQLRNIGHTAQRISNNYAQRRLLIAAQLAAGGHPG